MKNLGALLENKDALEKIAQVKTLDEAITVLKEYDIEIKEDEMAMIESKLQEGELDVAELGKVSGGFIGSLIGYKVVTTVVGALVAAVAAKYGYNKANDAVCDATGNPLPFMTCE